jgi:hypothetical protein
VNDECSELFVGFTGRVTKPDGVLRSDPRPPQA